MAQTYRSRLLAILRELETQLAAMFDALAGAAALELTRAAGPDGLIPVTALFALQSAIGLRTTRLFLGQTEGGRAPFSVLGDGSVYPLAPYSRVLFEQLRRAEQLGIVQQQNLFTQQLAGRPALLSRLRNSHDLFRNPLATYDPAHLWVDPSGYRLSERIWRTSGMTRRKLDLFLEERIRQGQGALDMSRDLERFLQPGRKLRTKAPYGTDASYDAMRLARTEITRAHAAAFESGAVANPFVVGLIWNLSASHPKPDICDVYAAGSPYPLDDHPMMPAHSHDLCYWTNQIVEDKAAVMAQLMGVPA